MSATGNKPGEAESAPSVSKDPKFKKYFADIEAQYCRVKGTPLILSPRDVQKASKWYEDGIPLEAVKLGIVRHFERLDPAKRKRAVVLAFAEHEIYDAWQSGDYKAARSQPRKLTQKQDIKTTVESFERRMAKLSKNTKEESVQKVFEKTSFQLARLVNTLRPDSPPETAEARLAKIEGALLKSLSKAAPEKILTAFHEAVEKDLLPFKKRMSAKVYKATHKHHTDERLLEHYGVPKISLF